MFVVLQAFALALACLSYHIRSRLSRTFFKFFQTFSFALVVCVARSNSAILAHSFQFVKNFFQVFQTFSFGRIHCCLTQLVYLITSDLICQELFSSFFKSFRLFSICSVARRQLAYTSTNPAFCQVLFSSFFSEKLGCLSAPQTDRISFISHHRSGRIRRPCDGRQPQKLRHCPHPGRRRNHVPAGSSAGLPPHGSWA